MSRGRLLSRVLATGRRALAAFRQVRARYAEFRFRRWLRHYIEPRPPLRPRPAVPTSTRQPKTILFFPETPTDRTVIFKICKALGYAMTGDPDAPWDVAFKWQDSTFFDRAVLGRLPGDTSIINGESVDISKTAVDAAMKRAFGYSAAVDPMRYAGLVVQKSDQNAKHDGTVVECPVTSGSVVPGCVYQRLIDNTVHGRAIYEFRVPVIGGQIPLVFVKYRPIERRFMIRNTIAQMTEAADVFSDDEITSLVAFSREMRLDYGELDVLRDNNDGRLYVVDANNTPHGPPKRLSPTQQQEAVARLGDALVALLRESGYSRSASRTPST